MTSRKKVSDIKNTKGKVVGWRVPCEACGTPVVFMKKSHGPGEHGETPAKPDNTSTCAACWQKRVAAYNKRRAT